ncbi:unnamed protein product [Fusarium equiseti]|uniref:MYND-type domain-containing protein n=1 Tax=Fusarium equiseti TaxID=61235 RepID=A0A8J2IVY6_FUSEQ|nr:unnamed protein product [Fusarium equiseti]
MVSCTNCGLDAPLRCAGCKGAPSYNDGEELNASYCSRECQKVDWPRHKTACRKMKERKSLLRAVMLLKATMVSHREAQYNWNLIKIEPREKSLILKLSRKRCSPPKPIKFPDHLTSNVEHKEAALFKRMGLKTLCVLGPMTRTLLEGIACTLEIVRVKVTNPPYPAILDPADPKGFYTFMDPGEHMIVVATLWRSNEKWVIDITGCQFGFKGALFPFEKYITEKHCTIIGTLGSYTQNETWDQENIMSLLGSPPPEQRAFIAKEMEDRRHFAALVKEHVNRSLIEGSDAEFEAKVVDFSQKVKTHMSSC